MPDQIGAAYRRPRAQSKGDRLLPLLKASTVSIRVQDNGVARVDDRANYLQECTGFFVAPDLVLTCAHVFPKGFQVRGRGMEPGSSKTRRPGEAQEETLAVSIGWTDGQSVAAEVVEIDRDSDRDFAVLRVSATDCPEHQCALLEAEHRFSRRRVWVTGYFRSRSDSTAMLNARSGEIDGTSGSLLDIRLDAGFGISGAPVLDDATGAVIGWVIEGRFSGMTSRQVNVVPASVLDTVAPSIVRSNRQYHAANVAWRDAQGERHARRSLRAWVALLLTVATVAVTATATQGAWLKNLTGLPSGTESSSAIAQDTVPIPTTTELTYPSSVPETPTDFEVISPVAGTVVLRWIDNAANESRFDVTRQDSLVRRVGANVTTTSFSGLRPGVSYHWDLKACNAKGCSDYVGVVGKTPDGSDHGACSLIATQPDVWVRLAGHDGASWKDAHWFATPSGKPQSFLFSNARGEVGIVTRIAHDFRPGEEVVIGILVREAGRTYWTGPAQRNPDDFLHFKARVLDGDPRYQITGGFEESLGGGDRDYNDMRIDIGGVRCE